MLRSAALIGLALCVSLGACGKKPAKRSRGDADEPARASASSKPRVKTGPFVLDGIKLGDRYGSTIMNRPPYAEPCDDDPIDEARRFMVYGGKPCRDHSFGEGTTVAFYIDLKPDKTFDQPVQAIAWLGGRYFDSRGTFPLWTGAPAAFAARDFGEPKKTFKVSYGDVTFTVQVHDGQVYSVIDGDVVAGFVIGAMPDDPQAESWRGLAQMYDKYTDKPALRKCAPSDAACHEG